MATYSQDPAYGNVPSYSASASSTSAPGATAPGSQNGTNVLSGFASRYNPALLDQNIWSNPFSILPDVFSGINTAGPGYQALRDFGADPLTLYNIMYGGTGGDLYGTGTSAGDYTNFLAGLYKSLGTVGGRGFSGGELLHSLFNPGTPAAGQTAGTPLYNLLTTGDLATQMRTLFNLASAVTNVGMNPLAAKGYQGALQRAGDQAMSMAMKQDANNGAANTPIYQLIRSLAPSLVR